MIVAASQRWSDLFQDFQITFIPSSKPAKRPLRDASLTAAQIISNMPQDDEFQTCLSQAQEMQKFNLDELIKLQVSTKNFRPIVHAEVLLHDYLLEQGVSHPSQYWNGWKYIGGSKPTCRLCCYYFVEHVDRVDVRPPHHNLYPNWRLPDIVAHEGSAAETRTLELLARLTHKVRTDAKRTLNERSSPGKRHDSNTYSVWPDDISRQSEVLICEPDNSFEGHPPCEPVDRPIEGDCRPGCGTVSAVGMDDDDDDDDGGASLI